MNINLTLRSRFTLLLGLCALAAAIPSGLLAWRYADDVRVAQREVDGTAPTQALVDLIRLVQQHRGLAAVWLGGDEAVAAQRAAKQAEVDQAAAAITQRLSAPGAQGSRLDKAWQQDVAQWQEVSRAVADKRLPGPESSARHTAVLAGMLRTLGEAADHWGLSFSSDLSVYFLSLGALREAPTMIELMGQTRARGANLLAAKAALDPAERARFEALQTRMRGAYEGTLVALDKGVAAKESTAPAIRAVAQRLDELAQQGIGLARRHVLDPQLPSYPGAQYVTETTQVIDGMYDALGQAQALLVQESTRSVSAAQRQAVAVLLPTLLLFAAAVVFALHAGRSIRRELGAEPTELRALAARVSQGDLSLPIQLAAGDQHSVMAALDQMQSSLAAVVTAVRRNAESVATASAQIAQGNQDLSQRTEQQASALQQTAATMDELGSTVGSTADHARQANQLAQGASAVASQGGDVVGQVVQTVKGINESSRRIADITAIIDGIAFQTNILALNAAVEAARAGEQGRGFAVVAGEVRTLAQRSAGAAKEIGALIHASVERAEQGAALADDAGHTMQEIVASIRRVTDIVAEISSASAEQRTGVAQVGQAVTQMDQATQQNAALVEQSAAAAESLRQQAGQLVQAVAVFKLVR